jgi:tRNA(Ile)-lysidine synthase
MHRLTDRPLPERVRRAIETHQLIAAGQRGLVALSGGSDSLCLLHVLRELASRMGFAVRAAHVDHGLRAASAEEAVRAARAAEAIGVEAIVLRASLERAGAGNLQERARRARLELLRGEAARQGCQWVALGHTASDQAETVLMRVVRGAGLRGLSGMAWRRGVFIRPLLDVLREEIQAYLAEHRLDALAVDDPTNAGDGYFRNRVRHHVLPLLAKENPAVTRTLCRLAATCREEDEALERSARDVLDSARLDSATIAVDPLRDLPAGLLHRALRLAFADARGTLRRLERRHVEAMAELVRAPSAGSRGLDLPGVSLERSYGAMRWRSGRDAAPRWEVKIDGPGSNRLGDGRVLHVAVGVAAGEPAERGAVHGDRASGVSCRLAVSRARFPLVARPPEPGDRIAVGVARHKKLARLLVDAKVPRHERARAVVLVSEGEVVAVVGLRCAHGRAPRIEEVEMVVTVAEES